MMHAKPPSSMLDVRSVDAHNVGEAKPILEIDDLSVSYGRAVTVGPISLSVREGEFVSLLGPSGCGKTTTLRSVAGFVQARSTGDIRVRGQSILREPPHRRRVGLVFQNYALFPHLSVYNNIAFGPRRHRFAKADVASKVEDIVRRLGLEGLEDRLPSQISGGQQQRVALGRALALDPDVLLLDEPLSNLDRKLRQQLRAELRRIHRAFRKTLIYVTHDQEEALSLSDRIVVMMGGRIVQIGTPREIYERPATTQVSEFIGECLSYGGRVVGSPGAPDETVLVEADDGMCWRVTSRGQVPADGSTVRITIRAESITPAAGKADGRSNVFPAEIVDRYFAGEHVRLVCQAPGGREIPINVDPDSPYAGREIGATLDCRVEPEAIHCFAEAAS